MGKPTLVIRDYIVESKQNEKNKGVGTKSNSKT